MCIRKEKNTNCINITAKIFQRGVWLIPQQITEEQTKIIFFYQRVVCEIWGNMCPNEVSVINPTGFKEHTFFYKDRINYKITIYCSSRPILSFTTAFHLLSWNKLCSKMIKSDFVLNLRQLFVLKQAVLYKYLWYLLDPIPKHNVHISAIISKASPRRVRHQACKCPV